MNNEGAGMGEGTLSTIKSALEECGRILDRAEFEWSLRHYDHAGAMVEKARDCFIELQHSLALPQFADYELDLFRFQAGQLDRAITLIEDALAERGPTAAMAAAAD
jgi:hypothetical protein